MGSETGRPAGTGDTCAAHSSQVWGEPGSSGADLHTHDEIFDLAQGSVIKIQTNQWCHNLPLSRFCACFYFLPAAVAPFLLFLKRINMDQKGWCLLFYVIFSTFAVLRSDAFNSHRFTSVNAWSPNHQRSVWALEAVFVHPQQFVREPDWIRRITNKKKLFPMSCYWKRLRPKSDSVYVLMESVVLKPVRVRNDGDFFPSLLPQSTIPILIQHIWSSFRSVFDFHLLAWKHMESLISTMTEIKMSQIIQRDYF